MGASKSSKYCWQISSRTWNTNARWNSTVTLCKAQRHCGVRRAPDIWTLSNCWFSTAQMSIRRLARNRRHCELPVLMVSKYEHSSLETKLGFFEFLMPYNQLLSTASCAFEPIDKRDRWQTWAFINFSFAPQLFRVIFNRMDEHPSFSCYSISIASDCGCSDVLTKLRIIFEDKHFYSLLLVVPNAHDKNKHAEQREVSVAEEKFRKCDGRKIRQ